MKHKTILQIHIPNTKYLISKELDFCFKQNMYINFKYNIENITIKQYTTFKNINMYLTISVMYQIFNTYFLF